jgi:hypothetical protein
MFAHHVFVADGGKVSISRAQRRTASLLALRWRIGGPNHARPGFGQAPGDHQGRGSARPRRSKEALYVAVLNRAARRIRGELQPQAGQHGSAAEVLAHVLSPSRAGGRHRPGSHGILFGDAATLLADPGLTEPAMSAARSLAGGWRTWCGAVMPGPAASRVMWLT